MLNAFGLAAVALLIAANGFFVSAEFSFVAARKGRLAEAEAAGDRRAPQALAVLRRLSFMLSGAQFGITVTSLVVGFIAEPTLGRALQPLVGLLGVPEGARAGVALTLGFVLATAAQMIFGELAPKNLAIARPESVALALARPTHLYLRVTAPLVALFDGAADALLRRAGIDPVEARHGVVHPEELPHIVDASTAAGSLSGSQAELLRRALEFRHLDAREVMVPWSRVVSIPADGSGGDVLWLLRSTRHTRFPIVDEWDEVVGMLHSKDLLSVPVERRGEVAVTELSRPVLAVPESSHLHRVLSEITSSASPMAIVVDEHGATTGVLTIEDLLEELVGEIADEFDSEEGSEVLGLGEARWRLSGELRLHEVARATGIELPEGPYDTLAGLLMDLIERVPVVGDRVEVAGMELCVVAMEGHRVRFVEMAVLDEPGGEGDRVT